MDGLIALALALYVLGWAITYSFAPLWLPMSMEGPVPRRFALAFAWPVLGAVLVVVILGTDAGFK